MPVLPHLRHEDARLAALVFLEGAGHVGDAVDDGRVGPRLFAIDAANGADGRHMAVEDLLQRQRNLAHGGLGPRGLDGQRQQIALGAGAIAQGFQRALHGGFIALGAQAAQLFDLLGAHGGIVDLQDIDGLLALGLELVDADDGLASAVNARLRLGGGLLDAQLGNARIDGLGHAAEALDLQDMRPCALRQILRQPLHIIGAAPGVDDPRGAALLLQEKLRVAGDAGGEIGWERKGLVQRIGVQALRVALRRGHGLDGGARDIVEDILRGERPAGGLAMGAQGQALFGFGIELLHQPRPQEPCGAQLGDLHEEVHPHRPEEGQARRELIDGEPRRDASANIFDAIGQRVSQLQILRRARFLHVIAGDGNRIELWHVLGGIGEDVGDDAHGMFGRVDIGVAHHEFFENVVLDRARELVLRHALFLRRHDIERQHRQHRAIHGHGYAHLVERNT